MGHDRHVRNKGVERRPEPEPVLRIMAEAAADGNVRASAPSLRCYPASASEMAGTNVTSSSATSSAM